MTGHLPSEPIMRAKHLCLLLVISFPYFITRLLTARCASRGMNLLPSLAWLMLFVTEKIVQSRAEMKLRKQGSTILIQKVKRLDSLSEH
jgi:hypothetical protein